jgi:ribosomal protein S18 acetylase RimI-like enzyme
MTLIRDATAADLPALADLLGELFALEAEFTPDRERQLAGLMQLHAMKSSACILVADLAGEVAGMAVLHYSVSTFLGTRVSTLEDVIVTRARRGCGIGRALLTAVVERARADGAGRITLLTDHDNRDAQEIYAKFGFTRSSMVPYRLMLERSLPA